MRAQSHFRSASVLVEVAFVLPILLVLILAVMEFGTLFFVRSTMLNAARDAVRSLSIGELDAGGAVALAQSRLPISNVDFAVSTSAGVDQSLDCWVEISAPLGAAALNDPLGFFGNELLTVRVTMRKED